MKKFLLAGFVVVAFVVYSIHQRGSGSAAVVVPPPAAPKLAAAKPAAPTTAGYTDGQYTGSVADAFYGNVQVQAVIAGGKISAVRFLQSPDEDSNSIVVNQAAMPALQQEAIQAQSAQVDVVSGATDTSQAFVQSLRAALAKAK